MGATTVSAGQRGAKVKVEWNTVAHPAHPKKPYELCITAGDPRAKLSFRHGKVYEPGALQILKKFVRRNGVFIDMGAHVGNHTIFMAKVAGARVIAFEPNPVTFDCLTSGVEANGLTERVTCHQLAVGDEATTGELIPSRSLGTYRVKAGREGAVEVRPLSDIYDGPVDAIKIDVEGGERAAVRGALPLIAQHRPAMLIESHKGVMRELRPLGYRKVRIPVASRATHMYVPNRLAYLRVLLSREVVTQLAHWVRRRHRRWKRQRRPVATN
jgi:FkbM family methyltransferase